MKKTRIKNHIKNFLKTGVGSALVLSCVLTAAYAPAAFAYTSSATSPDDVGKTTAELNGYSEEEWAALMDNTLEYSEIPDLVHSFNPTIVSAWNSFDENVDSLESIVDELLGAKKGAKLNKDNAKDSGDIAGTATYTMQEAIFGAASDTMKDSLDKLKRPVTGSNRPLRQAEAQVVSGVRQLMIGYKSLQAQKETLAELANMYEESYKMYQSMRAQGLTTDTEVKAALSSLMSARANLSSVDASETKLYKQLIIMCGWDENAAVNIGEVPSIGDSVIAEFNPDTDIAKAIGNNYTLIEERHSEKTYTLGGYESGRLSSSQKEANLRANLNSQYQAVLAAKQGYEAALAGYNGAQITKQGADMQQSLGMLSKVQYIGTNISYIQSKASLESARLTLTQAAVTYQDMVEGNASVE